MVLSAGLGTRLRPLTDRRAKPLVPVGDRPALAHVLERLREAGVPHAVVNAHHLAAQVGAFVRAQAWDVRLSEEVDLLGTAGGLQHAAALLGPGDALVWNGDILADVDVREVVEAHAARATLVVQPLPPGQGPVGVDAEGLVVRLRDERFGDEVAGGQYLGIAVLGAALRERLPRAGGLVEDVLGPALARGEPVRAWRFDGAWHDIGSVERYAAANRAWLEARGLRSFVAPGAEVGPDVRLEQSVVGEGARVRGSGELLRCIVWPGAEVVAPRVDAVVP